MRLVGATSQSNLTIVQDWKTYEAHQFGCLSLEARQLLLQALDSGPEYIRRSARQLCRYFEVYLFLGGERITEQAISRPSMLAIASGFVGALNSTRFMNADIYARKTYTRAFVEALMSLNQHCAVLAGLGVGRETKSRESELAAEFDGRAFPEEKLWVLRGWWIQNRKGNRAHLPLHALYLKMGRAFTQRFHDSCAAYVQGRVVTLAGVRELVEFISQSEELADFNLLDRSYVARFWKNFIIYYTQRSYNGGAGSKASTIVAAWNRIFVPFVRDSLVPAGLFAPPMGGYPNPRSRQTSGALSNVEVKDGVDVKTKLLTHVPLHLTDTEAIQTLFIDIRRDFDHVRKWADSEVSATNVRVNRRKNLATQGSPRVVQPVGTNSRGHKYISSRDNPEALANAAATFQLYGYVPPGVRGLEARLLYPKPLDRTAEELGLPVTGSVVPYLAILVAEHPAITTSFLENFQLYSHAGVRIGLARTDGRWYMVGDKDRRGPADAEQQIALSDAAFEALEGLISLTEPIRTYMREHGDDDWRYLLLSCGKGFGRPYRIRNLSGQMCGEARVARIWRGLHAHCGLSPSQAQALAHRFSLSRLRASGGTLVYLESRSAQKMAEVLGHKHYEPDLLSRYLPPALQEFFQERWIRIFQNGILAEALKDSPYLLESTDFKTSEELDLFLSQHALKTLPSGKVSEATPASKSEVVIGLDVGILTVLVGFERAVTAALEQRKEPGKNALHWASLTRALVAYVESAASGREDLQEQLADAKRQADSSQMDSFVYA